jgi:hypothetical protein
VGAVAVECPRADAGKVPVPHVTRPIREALPPNLALRVVLVEEAQLDRVGVPRVDRELRSALVGRGAERERPAGPDG